MMRRFRDLIDETILMRFVDPATKLIVFRMCLSRTLCLSIGIDKTFNLLSHSYHIKKRWKRDTELWMDLKDGV